MPRPPFLASRAPLRAAAAAASLAAALGACRDVAERAFQRPTVTFRSAAMREVGSAGGTVDVRLMVHNPNPYPLRASRARYRLLTADSAEVGRGEAVDSLRVPARDSGEIRLPVRVSWAALATAGAGALAVGAAEYRVLGEVVLADTPLGEVSVPVDARGRVPLRAPGGALGGALGGLLGR